MVAGGGGGRRRRRGGPRRRGASAGLAEGAWRAWRARRSGAGRPCGASSRRRRGRRGRRRRRAPPRSRSRRRCRAAVSRRCARDPVEATSASRAPSASRRWRTSRAVTQPDDGDQFARRARGSARGRQSVLGHGVGEGGADLVADARGDGEFEVPAGVVAAGAAAQGEGGGGEALVGGVVVGGVEFGEALVDDVGDSGDAAQVRQVDAGLGRELRTCARSPRFVSAMNRI